MSVNHNFLYASGRKTTINAALCKIKELGESRDRVFLVYYSCFTLGYHDGLKTGYYYRGIRNCSTPADEGSLLQDLLTDAEQ